MRKLKFWLPPVLWAGVIFFFSELPTVKTFDFYWWDFTLKKLAHIVEYGIFSILLYRALLNSGLPKKNAAVYSIVISILYGISDEYHQSFTPGREPKVRDVIFDTIGASLSIFVIWNLLPKMPEKLRTLAKSWQLI